MSDPVDGAKIHAEALRQFDIAYSTQHDIRDECYQDRKFYVVTGAPWEDATGGSGSSNRPRFDANKVHVANMRITSEFRNSRISVDFVPRDGASDTLSDLCDGLHRADEQDSVAEEAYNNAFEEAIGGGIGAWRLRDVYDEDDPYSRMQRIVIEPIYDADLSVFFDPNSRRQDKSDARYCFVLNAMTRDAYTEAYGEDPSSWPKRTGGAFDWCTKDFVYVAEYYRVTIDAERVHLYRTLTGEMEQYSDSDIASDASLRAKLDGTGRVRVDSQDSRRKKVEKYILSGNRVLNIDDVGQGRHIISGDNIPVVPVYGKRWIINGVERCMGHTRIAKDMARLHNQQMSALAEISAMSPVEKPIFVPQQMVGHAKEWADDTVKQYPFLLVEPIQGKDGVDVAAGPVGYTKSPSIPPAIAALLGVTDASLQELLGNSEQAQRLVSGVSGRTVEAIQQRLDIQTYIYASNMALARKRSAAVWLGKARKLYVQPGRKMRRAGKDGRYMPAELLRAVSMEKTGEVMLENDLRRARMDVVPNIGLPSASRRSAAFNALASVAAVTTDPETKAVLEAMMALNIEGEGISEARDFFRSKLIRIGVVKPTKEEAQQMAEESAQQGHDPNSALLGAMADEASAKADKAKADTLRSMAEAELMRAKTAEAAAKVASLTSTAQDDIGQ